MGDVIAATAKSPLPRGKVGTKRWVRGRWGRVGWAGRAVFALIVAAVLLKAAPCESVGVVVLRANLQFSTEPVAKGSRVVFSLPESGKRYSLSLEPEFDIKHHLVSLELVLQELGRETAATNMLDPAGHWHGYQKYMFAASDFVHGAEHSAYGRIRTISLDSLQSTLRVDIAQAVVSSISGTSTGVEHQFEKLDLAIEILRTTKEP